MMRSPAKPLTGLLLLGCSLLAAPGCPAPSEEAGIPEEVIRHNILGTAYLGQQKWAEAEQSFREALKLRPDEPLLLNNLAVALIQQGRSEDAEPVLRQALAQDAEHLYARYNLGLLEKNRGGFEAAVGHFEAVAAIDPDDLLTQYNLGIVLSRVGRDADAEQAFRNALALDPNHVSSLYGLGRFLLQSGDQEEGARMIALSQEIRARSGLDEAVGTQYGEQGPYAMGADFPADALAAPEPIEVRFETAVDVALTASPSWTMTRLEPGASTALVVAHGGALHAFSTKGLSEPLAPAAGEGRSVLALASADLDNDGVPELAAMLGGAQHAPALVLLRQDGQGSFEWSGEHSVPGAGAAPREAGLVAVDRDHDGDVDLFACWTGDGGAGCVLATNDGSGKLALESSSDHGFSLSADATGAPLLAYSDFDNDRDVDLLAAGAWGIQVFTNQRDNSFEEISEAAGLGTAPGIGALAVADVNKDGWMDLVLATADGLQASFNRSGRFAAPSALADVGTDAGALVVFDYDNDGFLDLAAPGQGAASLLRNQGAAGWTLVTDALPALDSAAAPLAAYDADDDGDLDLVMRSGPSGLTLLTNQGGNRNRWITVDPKGVNDNRFGLGAKVEILAGALRQKFEITSAVPLHAGLGQREGVQSVRVLWPGGVLQDEVELPAGETALVTQLDRKGTSCPLLYAWNEGAWSFVTDFLGGCAIGYQHAPGVFSVPDTDEYVRIDGGLTEEDGLLRLRLNNQLEEVIWFDQTELVVVDHPEGTEVYPNERLMPGPPWPEFALFASDDVRPIRSARGVEDGRDLSERLRESDRRYADNFELLPFKGYATRHTLELDLGPFAKGQRAVLLLDGWIDYADSSANVAAAQAGAELVPPRLLVADGNGGWIETGHVMGFPAGLPKTMTVEVGRLFPTADHRLRIESTMRIYWDRARVMLGGDRTPLRVERLHPVAAELRAGGFPRETSPDGRKPFAYDPQRVSSEGGWKAHVGAYTAFGDVSDLVRAIDDRFVTTKNGDEIELRFSAPPSPEPGWTRTYLLYADGFGKDMDPNSAASSEVGPIPFHGMPVYPYPEGVAPPEASRSDSTRSRHVLPSQRGWPGAVPQPLVTTDRRDER